MILVIDPDDQRHLARQGVRGAAVALIAITEEAVADHGAHKGGELEWKQNRKGWPMVLKQEALDYHSRRPPGKLEITPTKPCPTQRDLSLWRTRPASLNPVKEPANILIFPNLAAIAVVEAQKLEREGELVPAGCCPD